MDDMVKTAPGSHRRRAGRAVSVAVGLVALFAFNVSGVFANHVSGELDCGAHGIYLIDGVALPTGLDAPNRISGLFLLEDSTSVFRAFTIDAYHFDWALPSASRFVGSMIECTLSSSGPFFVEPWLMTGVLLP
jgi:hypothetical protein